MKTDLFILKGINVPGRVDIFKHGLVTLTEIGDEKALQIYREGNCPYLHPTEKGLAILYPDQKIIEATVVVDETPKADTIAVKDLVEKLIVSTKEEAEKLLEETTDVSALDYSDQMLPMVKFLELKPISRSKPNVIEALKEAKLLL